MDTMNDRAKFIFQTANAYAKAARRLNAESLKDGSMFLPSMANAALALELYFKSLYYLEHGKDFKVNGRYSHDFYSLFKELGSTAQCELQSEFQRVMQTRDMHDVLRLEAASGVPIPRDLAGNLEAWRDVFVGFRYIYDNMGKVKTMMFFDEIEQVLLDAIRKRRREWQS